MHPGVVVVSLSVMAVAGLGMTQDAIACRDSAVPLWDLVDSADLVVVAEVARSGPVAHVAGDLRLGTPSFTDRVAILSVRETWKGAAPPSLVVSLNQLADWPVQPAYSEGSQVLAFLRSAGGGWTTVDNSAGVIAATPAALEDLRPQVAEAAALQAEGQVSEAKRIDWTVRSALKASTRAEALSALVPGDTPCQGSPERPTLLAGRPTREQLGLIAEAFVREPMSDGTLPEILILLADYPDRKVDVAAIQALESALRQPGPPSWTRDALMLLAQRLDEPGHPEAAAVRRETAGESDAAAGIAKPTASIDVP